MGVWNNQEQFKKKKRFMTTFSDNTQAVGTGQRARFDAIIISPAIAILYQLWWLRELGLSVGSGMGVDDR